jgi:hypothetical protein
LFKNSSTGKGEEGKNESKGESKLGELKNRGRLSKDVKKKVGEKKRC